MYLYEVAVSKAASKAASKAVSKAALVRVQHLLGAWPIVSNRDGVKDSSSTFLSNK